jgi:hypothetical protein
LIDTQTWRPLCGQTCAELDIRLVHGLGKGRWCKRCRRRRRREKLIA